MTRPKTRPRTDADDRAERLARIDPSTLSTPELTLIEHYRAAPAAQRGALLTLLQFLDDEAARRLAEDGRAEPYHWKCDDPEGAA